MADSYGALIKTTTATTGTSDYVLATAVLPTAHRTPKQAVADGSLSDGDIVQYMVRDSTVTGDAAFEIGEGVYTDATNTVARLAANVWDSPTGPGNLHSWPGSGTRDFYLVQSPSSELARIDRVNTFALDQIFNGDVGIGTASPDSALDIETGAAGAIGPVLTMTNLGGGAGTGSAIDFETGGSQPVHARIYTADTGVDFTSDFTIQTKASGTGGALADRLTIDKVGSVGIGLTTPSTNLHIQESNTSNVPAIEVEQLSTGDAGIQLSIVGDSYSIAIDNNDSDSLKISYAASAGGAVAGVNDRLTIDSSGNIGIAIPSGTAIDGLVQIFSGSAGAVSADSQANELVIESNAGTFGMSFLGSNTSDQRIIFADVDNNQRAFIQYDHGDDQFEFRASNIASGILDSDGLMLGNAVRTTARLQIDLSTEDLEVINAGSASATEQDWVEVEVGGFTGFLRVFATK